MSDSIANAESDNPTLLSVNDALGMLDSIRCGPSVPASERLIVHGDGVTRATGALIMEHFHVQKSHPIEYPLSHCLFGCLADGLVIVSLCR